MPYRYHGDCYGILRIGPHELPTKLPQPKFMYAEHGNIHQGTTIVANRFGLVAQNKIGDDGARALV